MLKVTVYDKTKEQNQKPHDSVEIASLIDIRDKLDQLILSLTANKKTEEQEQTPKQEEQTRKIHRLTPAELGKFFAEENKALLWLTFTISFIFAK